MHAVERAGRAERLERLDDDDVAALHVDDAWPARLPVAQPLELLERTVGLEHRVEMADQEHPAARPRALRHEMPRALEWSAVHPPGREPQRFELGREQLSDFAHAGMVPGPAVDVHGALEQRQRLGIVRVHVGDDGLFVGRQGWGRLAVGNRGNQEDGGNCDRNEPAHGHSQY